MDSWILRQSFVKDPDRWTLQRSCNPDQVEHIETGLMQAKAASDFSEKFRPHMWRKHRP